MPRLRDLEAVEVSLVPRGANKKKFLILKSEGGNKMPEEMQAILQELLETELENEDQVEEILKQKKLSPKATNAIKGALRLLNAFKDELPKDIMGTMAGLAGYGYAAPKKQEKEPKKPYEQLMKEDLDGLDVPDEVKTALTALWKQNESMVKRNEILETVVKKQESDRLTAQYVEVAKSYENISIKPEEFGIVLKEIALKAPDVIDKVQEVLKAADAAIKEAGLFKEIGSSSCGPTDAWNKIEKAAEAIVETDKITKAEAITKAMEQNPDLYTEYLKEGGVM